MSANLLEAMGHATNYLDQFGGHAMAAGFEAKRSTFDLFRSSLEVWAESLSGQSEIGSHVVEYDATCRLSDLNPTFMAWHEHMGPFGAHAPIPMFLISDCLVAQVKVLKGGHLRLKLAQAGAPAIQAIWFGPPIDFPISQGNRVDLIAEVQWNHYQGSRSIQLLVSDVKIAGTGKA
jgi:single-stranded-DNA-specific exonuclease